MKVTHVNSFKLSAFDKKLSFIGQDNWSNFVNDVYKYKIYRLLAEDNATAKGVLALAEINHPIFGHYLTTAPFGSYGGFAYETPEARDALLDEARRIAEETKAEYVSIRFDEAGSTPPEAWSQVPSYYTFLIDLPSDPDELLKQFSSDHRNHVRKSLKKGHSIRFGHLDLLDDAYEAIARSMHELGSPYHSKSYLRKMAEYLGNTLEFAVVYNAKGKITGGGVFIQQGDTVFNLHANILRHGRSGYAGEFLYWSVIERNIQKGLRTFDLGRSLVGSGNEVFKMKWAPRKELLAYWFWIAPGHELPSLNQKNPKFQFAIAAWKRLPTFIIRPLGPFLIRGLA